ncbi:MAG: hypothetical protein E7253_10060 [Lachnospiraceae bacterium]|nr:hypothetical protein [Lachnospiraceae bacterium]
MTDHELELRLKNAVEACTPDVLSKVMAECDNYQKKEAEKKKQEKIIDISHIHERNRAKEKRGWKRYASMAAMLVLMIGAGAFGSMQYQLKHVVSIVQFDVNPSVEIRINKSEEVVKAVGLNKDGEEILSGMKLAGLDIYTATNAMIGSLLKHGYIDELANSILLSVEDEDSVRGLELQEGLTGEIEAILKSASINASILSQHVDGNAVDQVSQEYGISHGKASLIESILKSNSNYTFEELSKLSVNELNLIVSNPKNQVEGVQATGNASKTAYIGEEKANQIAFSHAGVEESSVYQLEIEMDYEYGSMVYDVEFTSGEKEYEYYIDAKSGEVLEHEVESED